MNTKKTALTALTIATLLVAGGLMAIQEVRADNTNPRSNFIQKLAEQFGLNQDDVQTFFNEQRQERSQKMEQRHEEHMSELVANGTITEAQKQALESKHEELQNEMNAWAETQGIDLTLIRPRMGMHHGQGIGF